MKAHFKILFFTLFLLCSVASNAQIKFYVSPSGNDTNVGTKTAPFLSLQAARDAIRSYKETQGVAQSFDVIVADGLYTMQQTLVLTEQDGGTLKYPIVYKAAKGAKPVFSGGKKIVGFKVNEDGIWQATIAESKKYGWRFDQLYVNDQRATLARTPNRGFLKIKTVKETVWERGNGRYPIKAVQRISFDSLQFKNIKSLADKDIPLLRFRAYHKWDFTLRHVDHVNKDSMVIHTSGKGMKPWNPLFKGGRIVFENYKAALDTAGEWFLDSEGTLFYIPLEGQTIENTMIIAPLLKEFISFKGDLKNGNYIEHVAINGLSFKHCHFQIPASGSEPNQAAVLLNASISLEAAKNIRISNCEISLIGQHAIWFKKGCSASVVEHSYLHHLGGGGVYLGDFKASERLGHTKNISLHNNIIQTGGQEFPSAVGVWVGHSSDNRITNNDIGNFYYSGISIGWVWGYTSSLAKRNTVSYNNIHHIGWDLLSDMAAVYTLGKSEGTVISHNIIHHVHAYSYGGWGLYTDEGSTGITMENNLVYSTKTGGFHQHYGKENSIKNNIFAFAKLYQAQCTRVEKHRSFNFDNNIILFDQGTVLTGAWKKIDIHMDQNMYWNMGNDAYHFVGGTFKKWQQTGHDTNSVILNPNFKDAYNFDFRFKNKKNIRKINFTPFDYDEIGVFGDADWKQKAVLSKEIRTDFDRAVEQNMNKNLKH